MERPRTSSVIVTNFRYLHDQMQNTAMAEESRRTYRMSKGLNPNAPRPSQMKKPALD